MKVCSLGCPIWIGMVGVGGVRLELGLSHRSHQQNYLRLPSA